MKSKYWKSLSIFGILLFTFRGHACPPNAHGCIDVTAETIELQPGELRQFVVKIPADYKPFSDTILGFVRAEAEIVDGDYLKSQFVAISLTDKCGGQHLSRQIGGSDQPNIIGYRVPLDYCEKNICKFGLWNHDGSQQKEKAPLAMRVYPIELVNNRLSGPPSSRKRSYCE